jgi:hypothetical protein
MQSMDRHAGTQARALDKQPATRLQAHDVVEGRGNTPRSGRIGCESERHLASRDSGRRARARATGHEARIERILGNAVRTSDADQSCRELVEVGFSDEERARSAKAFDDKRRSFGNVGEIGTGNRRRHAGDVDAVLYPSELSIWSLPHAASEGTSAMTMAGACRFGLSWKACEPMSMPM